MADPFNPLGTGVKGLHLIANLQPFNRRFIGRRGNTCSGAEAGHGDESADSTIFGESKSISGVGAPKLCCAAISAPIDGVHLCRTIEASRPA